MALCKLAVIQTRFPFPGVEILTTFSFLCHHFASRNAGKPIKGSKDSDDSLVLNVNLSEKNGSLDWDPEPPKVGQINAKVNPQKIWG